MASANDRRRQTPSRRFQPSLEGRLETRELMSHGGARLAEAAHHAVDSHALAAHRHGHIKGTAYHYLLTHTNPKNANSLHVPRFLSGHAPFFLNQQPYRRHYFTATQTARGGQAVEVTALDGSHYMIKLSYTSNTTATNIAEGANGQNGVATTADVTSQVSMQNANYPQPLGTIRAYPMSGGRIGLIIDGSTPNTEVTINPLGEPQIKGFAHSFAYGESSRKHLLNIGQITVDSGQIGSILGFQDASLSGPLMVNGSNGIDRIAFDQLLPGASITTGGDLNTLDILQGATLSGAGTGVSIGRDLNMLNVGGTLSVTNGATFKIGRDLGLVSQPPKGTGTGSNVLLLNFNSLATFTVTNVILPPSVGAYIQGNVIVGNGSAFTIGRAIDNTMYIEGGVIGFSRILVNAASTPTSPPLEIKIPSNVSSATGFVTALGGAGG